MAVNFHSDPAATGFFAPARFEADVFDCEVEGRIPADLDGAFYRVGPDHFYPPKFRDDANLFHGDGHVGMFRIVNGSCDYKSRYVRTPRYLADRKARKQLFGNYRNDATNDPAVRGLNSSVANTALVHNAGRLFVLKEDSLPWQIDPNTLETLGNWDFYGKYTGKTFSAHPKIDPLTGDLLTFGYEATGLLSNDVYFYVIGKDGHVKQELRFKAPVVSMMHDMAVTRDHIIFNTCGFTTSKSWLDAGKVHWGWDAKLPTYVGILPRNGTARDLRWFKGPTRAAIHILNAETRGSKVIVETPVSDANPFPFFPQVDGSPWDAARARTMLRRWTFDLDSSHDGFTEEILFPDIAGTLPRIDERYWSLPYRYGYVGYHDALRPYDEARAGVPRARVTNSYARMDLRSGKVDSYFAGSTHSLSEVQFVPRGKGAAEGDGYLIGHAANFAERCSELIIADATRPADGDIARIRLPFRAHPQVHGWWVDAADLPLDTPA
jgi:carotenoid cleavage dioxygenase